MKLSVFLLSALMLMHVASPTVINAAAREESPETERVVGGREAAEGQFPWAAALYRRGSFICTCSIISENTVMTAAHCVQSDGVTGDANDFHAIANVKKSMPDVRINFTSVTPHPDYSQSNLQNDIALFRTSQPIQFSDTVKPICIARNDTPTSEYRDVLAMGWGDTERFRVFPFIPDTLNYVEQKVVSNRACSLSYFGRRLEDSKICAGDLLTGICNGDSGGPLVSEANPEPVQIGVASYGNAVTGCGFLTPSVWTRVSFFNSFIKEVAAGDVALCEV